VLDSDVAGDVTAAADSSHLETLQHVTNCQTLDMTSSMNDDLVVACRSAQIEEAVDDTSTLLIGTDNVDRHSVCVSGHLQSITSDMDDPCSVCEDQSSCVLVNGLCDFKTPSTRTISTSGDDGKLDDIESLDVEKCQRVAEQLSAAWVSSVRHADVLDSYDDGDLLTSTLPTLTSPPFYVS